MNIKDILTKKKWVFYLFIAVIGLIIGIVYSRQEDDSYLFNENEFSHPHVKNKKYKNNKIMEHKCRAIIENIFKRPFSSYRPDFLKYKNGKNLELDIYNPELSLAFEYQGRQHYSFTPFFHSSYNDFVKQQERDVFKRQRCEELGITLIEIPDSVKSCDLEKYIQTLTKNF
jgi:hypothetical protein